MSGHSKWSQIKHRKGIADAKKGKVFGKLAKAISIAARDNPDPSTNLRLKGEVERARAVNMPNDSIQRAIKRVSDKAATQLSEISLELIGPGTAAIVVSAITDNRNRTIGELKQLATKMGARMAGQGAVAWMFKRSGVIRLTRSSDEVALAAIDAGADDVQTEDGKMVVYTAPEHLDAVKTSLGNAVESSTIELLPTTLCPVPDPQQQQHLEALLDALDEHDDVQEVFTNADY